MTNLFDTFPNIYVSYTGATYYLVKRRGGTLRAYVRAVSEVLRRRMPLNRMRHAALLGGQIEQIEPQPKVNLGEPKPYDAELTKHIHFEARTGASAEQIADGIQQVMLILGNDSIDKNDPPGLSLRLGDKRVSLSPEPEARNRSIHYFVNNVCNTLHK